MWLGWILASCAVLSVYDLGKKASVRGNAVFPVLLGSTLSGWLAVTAFLACRGGLSAAVAVPRSTAGRKADRRHPRGVLYRPRTDHRPLPYLH